MALISRVELGPRRVQNDPPVRSISSRSKDERLSLFLPLGFVPPLWNLEAVLQIKYRLEAQTIGLGAHFIYFFPFSAIIRPVCINKMLQKGKADHTDDCTQIFLVWCFINAHLHFCTTAKHRTKRDSDIIIHTKILGWHLIKEYMGSQWYEGTESSHKLCM